MEVKASVKTIRISPRKLRLVVDQVRGQHIKDARATLELLRKKGSEPVLKLLNSAVANAVHNNKLSENDLFIKTIQVNEGFTIKRYMPRAFGKASAIRKRTSHINITLEDRAVKTAAPVKGKAKKGEKSEKTEKPKTEKTKKQDKK